MSLDKEEVVLGKNNIEKDFQKNFDILLDLRKGNKE